MLEQIRRKPDREGGRKARDEGGRMKDEGKAQRLSLHPSSFRLHPSFTPSLTAGLPSQKAKGALVRECSFRQINRMQKSFLRVRRARVEPAARERQCGDSRR